ncbi:MAG: hypothetical protein V3V99_08825 [candidate division Zixibacteria bacterium]
MRLFFAKYFMSCILAIMGLILISCSSQTDDFQKAPYVADDNLLDAPVTYTEINLDVSPPDGWTAMDNAKLDMFRRMLGGTEMSTEFYPVYPLAVYQDSVTGLMMYVSMIEESEATLKEISEKYEDFLMPKLKGSGVDRQTYLINGMQIYQYLVHSSQIVNYKILGETTTGGRFLIEYISGTAMYSGIEPAIKASLAALKTSQ